MVSKFKSGMQGVFHTSWVAYQGDAIQCQEIEIYGTHGRLLFRADHTGTILRGLKHGEKLWQTVSVQGITLPAERNSDEDIFRPGRHNETNTTYRFVEAIRLGKTDETPNMVEGLRSQEVIDAVLKASAERRWIDV